MKKFISLTLITIMILAATVLPIFAANSEDFTQKGAEELFFEGYKLFHVYQDRYCMQMYGDVYQDETRFYANFEGDTKIRVYPMINGEQYELELITGYFDGNKLHPIESIDDLKKIAGDIFDESLISSLMIDVMYDEPQPLFYQDSDGKIYHNYRGANGFPGFGIVGYSDFKVDGDKASIVVDFKYETLFAAFFVKDTVEFVKTDAGWRIANNIFSDEHYNRFQWKGDVDKVHYHWDDDKGSWSEKIVEYHINTPGEYPEDLPDLAKSYLLDRGDSDNPNTGDTTVTTAALLATIALAAVITPFALSKKRRVR